MVSRLLSNSSHIRDFRKSSHNAKSNSKLGPSFQQTRQHNSHDRARRVADLSPKFSNSLIDPKQPRPQPVNLINNPARLLFPGPRVLLRRGEGF